MSLLRCEFSVQEDPQFVPRLTSRLCVIEVNVDCRIEDWDQLQPGLKILPLINRFNASVFRSLLYGFPEAKEKFSQQISMMTSFRAPSIVCWSGGLMIRKLLWNLK